MPKLSLTSLLMAAFCGILLLLCGLYLFPMPGKVGSTQQSGSQRQTEAFGSSAYSSVSVSNVSNQAAAHPGVTLETLRTLATISVGTHTQIIQADSIGLYPKVHVTPKATIPIHLQVQPNELVREEVLDGGKLDDKSQTKFQYSDASGNLDFDYSIREEPGNYRVAVYRQGLRQILNFWVGPDLPSRAPVSNE